jgi:hypothetical protein
MLLPNERVLNSRLSGGARGDVVKIEVLRIQAGDLATVQFLGTSSEWRQGVWLATNGLLDVNGERLPQVLLWTDTAPAEVTVSVVETDGLLRLCNIWDSGRGLGPFESQSATSGMLVADGIYRCSDIASDPAFDRLVFSLDIKSV